MTTASTVERLEDGDYVRICDLHQWAGVPGPFTPPECPRCADDSGFGRYLEHRGDACSHERIIAAQAATIAELHDVVRTLAREAQRR